MTSSDEPAGRSRPDLSFLERRPARASEIPNLGTSSDENRGGERRRHNDSRTLTVGRDIVLSGDITECDVIVVEGRLTATVPHARALEISSSGEFKGTAHVTEATISGHFEGDLVVEKALHVTASGCVSGKVRYGHLEIDNGGEIYGDVTVAS